MEDDKYIKKKITLLTVFLLTSIICSFAYGIFLFNYEKEDNHSNRIRILVSSQITDIKNGVEEKDDFIPYAKINTNGLVEYSSIEDINKGETLNLESDLGYDNAFSKKNEESIRYSTAITDNGSLKYMLAFNIPRDKVKADSCLYLIIPLVIFIVFAIFISIKIYKFVNNDIVRPIGQLHRSAKKILKGDYSQNVVYDYDGEIGGFCHDFELMRDELKYSVEKEKQLKKNEKELLACISHDLRTPLTSIAGYVEGIRDGVVKDEKGIRKYADIILRKSRDLSKLIDDILEQSKTELNQLSINKKEVYSKQYFQNFLEEASIETASNGMKLNLLTEIPDVIINIDENRINEVMMNILSNSMKYSETGNVIDVRFENDLDRIIISIKDNGMGISFSDIPFVFDKFYRGDKTRNSRINGSGLGLSIAKYIVESHGGKIKCRSEINKGTEILFYIPKY